MVQHIQELRATFVVRVESEEERRRGNGQKLAFEWEKDSTGPETRAVTACYPGDTVRYWS
jgi:hypothetical protein